MSPLAGGSLKYLQADAPSGAASNIEADRQDPVRSHPRPYQPRGLASPRTGIESA